MLEQVVHIVTTVFEGAFGKEKKQSNGKGGRARDNERTQKEVGEGNR